MVGFQECCNVAYVLNFSRLLPPRLFGYALGSEIFFDISVTDQKPFCSNQNILMVSVTGIIENNHSNRL